MTDREANNGAFWFLAACLCCVIGILLYEQSRPADMLAPTGLICELTTHPEWTEIEDERPEFGWIVNSEARGDVQTAYQVQVAASSQTLTEGKAAALEWDSGKVASGASTDIEYDGRAPQPGASYFWRVRTWNKSGDRSPYSAVQEFRMAAKPRGGGLPIQSLLRKTRIEPERIVQKAPGHYFMDFGRAAFGTVRLALGAAPEGGKMQVRLGEKAREDDSVDPQPGGSIRYRMVEIDLEPTSRSYTVVIPADERNTGPDAIPMPEAIGEVMPFRYCEVVGAPSPIGPGDVRQIAVHYSSDDDASRFRSGDAVLDGVWEMCKYTIRATSFCGIYVDGDRERIPYEADAYINQLCHYCVDRDYAMARASHEYLIRRPTWPTEWLMHSVLMAWADYMWTGNTESMDAFYDDLVAKTLLALAREDGLISTRTGLATDAMRASVYRKGDIRDIVDWPPGSFTSGGTGEQDGYVFTDINTVVNAFHYCALDRMGQIAEALGRPQDAADFRRKAERVRAAINSLLFDAERGVYVDGEGTDHTSLHANMFPLAFGIVPPERQASVVAFIKTRGMACSVYGAQYLLEALYRAEEDRYALELLRSKGDRSWWNMIRAGSTVALEAWDIRYKDNLDWNHAWGAVPANIIPRCLMGIEPMEPGFAKVRIKPQPGDLGAASIDMPTIKGTIHVDFEANPGTRFVLNVALPVGVRARVYLPSLGLTDPVAQVDGDLSAGRLEGKFVVFDEVGSGRWHFELLERKIAPDPAEGSDV